MRCRVASAVALIIAVQVAAAEVPLRITTPQPVAAGTYVPIAFEGEGLDAVASVTLQRRGSGAVGSSLVTRSANALVVSANLATQPVGLYTTTLSFQGGGQRTLAYAMELSRSPGVLLSGTPVADAFEPLAGIQTQSNTEYLVDLPTTNGSEFTGLSFFLAAGSPAPTGRFVLRYRSSQLATFSTTMLDGPDAGWLVIFDGGAPTPTADGELFFPGFATILPDDGGRIQLSVIHESTGSSGARLVQCASAAQTGRRGVSSGNVVPPEEWSGTVPPQRNYLARQPVMRLYYSGQPVAADFQASALRIIPGTEVSFTNRSSSNATRLAWDLDGDGVQDATGAAATHRYDRPGVYTVILTAADGYAEDAETKLDLIEVIDPAAAIQDRWIVK